MQTFTGSPLLRYRRTRRAGPPLGGGFQAGLEHSQEGQQWHWELPQAASHNNTEATHILCTTGNEKLNLHSNTFAWCSHLNIMTSTCKHAYTRVYKHAYKRVYKHAYTRVYKHAYTRVYKYGDTVDTEMDTTVFGIVHIYIILRNNGHLNALFIISIGLQCPVTLRSGPDCAYLCI